MFETDQIDVLNHGFKALVGTMTIRTAIQLDVLISVIGIVAIQQILDTQNGRWRTERIVFALAIRGGAACGASTMTVEGIFLNQCGNALNLGTEIPKVSRDLLR